jgi:Flp pilus assembly protein TadG
MLRRLHKREDAQSLAEFALVVPIFLILVFGIIDFGMGLRAYITVSQATREGARYAAVGNPAGTFAGGGTGQCDGATSTSTVGRVCSAMDGLDLTDIQTVAVTYPNGQIPGNSVRVRAEYRYHYITPIRTLLSVFTGGSVPSYLTISSTTDMRLE